MLKKIRVIDYNLLRSKGVHFDRLNLNRLVKYPTENRIHFAVKSQVFYILRTMGHNVLTEFEITGFGIGDILDLSTKVTCQYEIETTLKSAKHQKTIQKYARKGLDIIIVFTPKLPSDEYERYKYLKDVIIVPD
ncbi:MAG: hypothetical protein JSV56_02540 [Methanomassiliicoccales archaeon]|nr:MAG: hypothetical protein JSV56_02540 [Methanomassiliicoccales archaeon]